jgi:23S rRNA maturation mini-RNase III
MALVIISTLGLGIWGLVKYLYGKIDRLESKVDEKKLSDLHDKAVSSVSKKSHADIVDLLNKQLDDDGKE